MLTPKEAAGIIGCSPAHVRLLIRKGLLPATKKEDKHNQHGYEYRLEPEVVEKYRTIKSALGRPRGGGKRVEVEN